MDFMTTKGIEYLLCIGYLLLLIPFWMAFFTPKKREARTPVAARLSPVAAMRSWFQVPEGYAFHPGHAWVVPEGAGVFRVGVDDFAQRLVGAPDHMLLPNVGSVVEQGEPAFRLGVDGKTLVHPFQLPYCNDAFTPKPHEVSAALEVIDALDRAHGEGRGTVVVNGRLAEGHHLKAPRGCLRSPT